MMKLKQLIKGIEGVAVKGSKEIEISGLSSHSKKVAPGDLFLAKKGLKTSGIEFIKDAFLSGAKAVVTDLYNPFFKDKTQIIVKDVAQIEPILAKKFYQDPSKDLFLVGVTGTNGKTTVTYLIHHLLSEKTVPAGLIGTIEVITGKNRFFSQLTTPDTISLNKYLKEMVSKKIRVCSMEVSSHALDQNRIEGIDFDHVIFTNLTQDHLDYHGTMKNYVEAKQKLFLPSQLPKKRTATINLDSPYASQMFLGLDTMTVSLKDPKATFYVYRYVLHPDHTVIEFSAFGKTWIWSYPLIGLFNIYNVLEAASAAYRYGFSLQEIEKKMKTIPVVPGRMQKVPDEKKAVFIDYAHTEDALMQALMTLKQMKFKQVYVLFGCGGDRDRDKRAKMGKVASDLADVIILTQDNPRNEDPLQIVEMIQKGIDSKKNPYVILDRKEAIETAIQALSEEDCLLIAGKGHENYQIFQNKTIEFNDFEVAKSALME